MSHNDPALNNESIKPKVNEEEVKSILKEYYGFTGGNIKLLIGFDDLNYYCLPENTSNGFIQDIWPHGYIVKIMNSNDSMKVAVCDAQNDMMFFLRKKNIPAPIPVKNLSGHYFTKIKFPLKYSISDKPKEHIVRLLEFQPGTVLKDAPKSFELFYKVGIFLGKLNEVLKEFTHSAYNTHESKWHLHSVMEVKKYLEVVTNVKQKHLVEQIVNEFIQKVLPQESNLDKGIIHGDVNENNILVRQSENGDWRVSAILDFGDSHLSCYEFELAILLCYMMFECKRCNIDILIGSGYVIAGYLNVRSTFLINYNIIKISICTRICQSLVLGLHEFSLQPENTYVLDSQNIGWAVIEELWKTPVEDITEKWKSIIHSCNESTQYQNAF